ncbi:hypothetical protein H310_12791 [Aphanomyces invadans]|uniref:Metalloenzyme domain-containing protein n=1 Tax=Aphanomyces invadans TaxID=157072 RepID=A0A024TIK0_9STRA|nr:hypothetical protein H310_12791 [Aphanomyces invadans]ETV93187.1 hypothetical protein H310_12791 [Aphanomyces invadans]|eukprot:XP_008878209.1 hypothetical protein H310_12791 [Aphanomyces invadans]
MTAEKKRHPVVFVLIDGIGDMSMDVSKYHSAHATPGTTLQAAHTPAMDAIARAGLNGLLDPVEPGMACGSDTAHMSIFGYPPTKHYRGRGSFEAMGAGLDMAPGDVAFKCNFAYLDRATNVVAMRRVDRNFHAWGKELCPYVGSVKLPSFPGVGVVCKYATEHRCGIVFKGSNLSDQITGTDPLKDELPLLKSTPIDPTLPSAVYSSKVLNEASDVIIEHLSRHPLNVAREAQGLVPANLVLFRGPGERINVPNFEATHGMKAFMIAPTCIIAGLGMSLDMDLIRVEGATGDYHTNLVNKANAALECFRDRKYDFGFVHVKAVDDAGHDRDVPLKMRFLEKADAMIARLIQGLDEGIEEEATIIVTGDHTTPVLYGDHTFEPVPFTIANVRAAARILRGETTTTTHELQDHVLHFSEVDAAGGILGRFSGDQVMEIVKQFRARNV